MNGSIPAVATETAHRRADSGCGDAVGAARDAAEAGGSAGESRVSSTAPPVFSPCPCLLASVCSPACPPRSHAFSPIGAPPVSAAVGACGAVALPSPEPRIAAARLSELAAEARAGGDATTLDRLIVEGLTRYYHGIDNEAPAARKHTNRPPCRRPGFPGYLVSYTP